MAGQSVEGVVWARPEAADALGRRPGSARTVILGVLGCISVAVGVTLGTSVIGPAAPAPAPAGSTAGGGVDPDAAFNALLAEPTCADVGVTIPADRIPARGVPEAVVIALYRADASGESVVLVPRAHVLTSTPRPDGGVQLSVLVRIGATGDDRQVADLTGASAAGTLTASVLYDVDPNRVLDECRET